MTHCPETSAAEVTRRRTKIVATTGPACCAPSIIAELIQAGVDVFRLNFSHGTRRQHEETLRTIRQEADNAGRAVAVMQDLQGPRIRTGLLREPSGIELRAGEKIAVVPGEFEGDLETIPTSYRELPHDVGEGDRILISSGALELKVLGVRGERVECVVVTGGHLAPHQGVNLPGVELSISAPTAKDLEDLKFAVEMEVDYIALSFVGRARDVLRLKEALAGYGPETAAIPVIAKIERPDALDDLRAILDVSDGVMVARGDLGIEMPAETVPAAQKSIICEANQAGMPVITATQMLESMIDHPRPTRAEASDVANAILDGTDAVMLSGETAVGRYPARAVRMMHRIAAEIEPLCFTGRKEMTTEPCSDGALQRERALAAAACFTAEQLGAKGIAAFTLTGTTARCISQRRPSVPVFALSPSAATRRRMALLWGVIPLEMKVFDTTDEMIEFGEQRLLEEGLAQVGDTVVCAAGASTRTPGGTDMLKIHYFDGENPYVGRD